MCGRAERGMKKQQSEPSEVYQLKVTLNGSKPKIWRTILVKPTTPLSKLHRIIQRTMGWDGGHMHQFEVLGEHYGCADPEWGDPSVQDERKLTLGEIASLQVNSFTYEYDFGDDWKHEITIEKTLPAEKKQKYPLCIAGELACPPEDCGGIWGYYGLLDAIKNPKHAEHEQMKEWVGEDFDPNHFILEEVNRALSHV